MAAGLPARCRVRAGWPGQPLTTTVFQKFALFPWRTAEANVAFGLEELDIPAEERRARVRRFITMTGLEGFEGKYPHARPQIIRLGFPFQDRNGRLLVPDIERQMLWWTANGFMKRTIPLRSIVDTSFVDEAAKAVPEQ